MRKLVLFCAFAVLSMQLSAQKIVGNDVSEFHTVNLSGKLTTEFIQGSEPGVVIEPLNAESNKIEWGITEGVLSIKFKSTLKNEGSARVTVTYTTLESIKLSGGEARVTGELNQDMITLELQGGAKFTGMVECRDLSVSAGGSSAASISGKTKYLRASAGMSSKLELTSLDAMSAEVSAGSTAEVFVNAGERLIIDATTGSTVSYKGSPLVMRFSSKFGSSIIDLDKGKKMTNK